MLPLLVTFKLSTLAWSATGILVALWSRRHLLVRAPGSGRRIVAIGLAFGAVLVLSWMIRGVVPSGYLAYPSPATAVPVEWRAPLEQAAAEQAWIQ